jgi:hypothetical protein
MPPRWLLITVLVWILVSVALTLLVTLVRHKGMTP